jgi:hypothetical protein
MRRVFGHTVIWLALLVGEVAAVLSETVVMLGCIVVAVTAYALSGGRNAARS